jgi:hypothetical protein
MRFQDEAPRRFVAHESVTIVDTDEALIFQSEPELLHVRVGPWADIVRDELYRQPYPNVYLMSSTLQEDQLEASHHHHHTGQNRSRLRGACHQKPGRSSHQGTATLINHIHPPHSKPVAAAAGSHRPAP